MIEKKCIFCGVIFKIHQCWIRKGCGKYCSRKCKNLSQEKYKNQRCIVCGKEFRPHQKNRKFCSLRCAYGHRKKDIKNLNVACKHCGKRFHKMPNKKRVYCSQECRKTDKRVIKQCINCRKEFSVLKINSLKRNFFCSFSCYRKYSGESSIEKKFREELEKRNIGFKQEVKMGRYCIDFMIGNIAVELDGKYWHDRLEIKRRDKLKEEMIKMQGYMFLRFKEEEINSNIEDCFKKLNLNQ